MFTGIIEAAAACADFSRRVDGSAALTLTDVPFAADLVIGESVAVNGCCLTVVDRDPARGAVRFDILAETLRVTNLGDLQQGSVVNLERAVRAGDRLSGHIVQGHVDTAGRIRSFETNTDTGDVTLDVALPETFRSLVVPKGSIAVDGISLTIAALRSESFTACIIPHTLRATNLCTRKAGDAVNLEFDLLAKYATGFGR